MVISLRIFTFSYHDLEDIGWYSDGVPKQMNRNEMAAAPVYGWDGPLLN